MSEHLSIKNPEAIVKTELLKNDFEDNTYMEVGQIEYTMPVSPDISDDRQIKINTAKSEALMAIESSNLSQPENLSVEDAASEYLSILDELSSDFTNPRAVTSQLPLGDTRGIGASLNGFIEKYDHDNKYSQMNYRLDQAKLIIDAEIDWQEAGEKYGEIKDELDTLDKNWRNQNLIKKVFSYRRHRREGDKLKAKAVWQSRIIRGSNHMLEAYLGSNYSESGENAYHPKDMYEKNDERNSKFFDGADRQEKIERAIELRQKYLKKEIPKRNPLERA